MPKKIAVIDGNSLMHRAFHAVPPTMNAPDGTPTNAVFGFLAMLLKFIDMAHPDGIVCAFDAGRPAFRMEALHQYKAQRPPMDSDLKVQFPLIEELLDALNIPVIRIKGWEGDDILGTVAARGEVLGYETLLVTGDKDAYQLASDMTRIVTTKKGITDVALYGPEEVELRYGVRPDQFTDFLGLKGDSSDNIPGVVGIGDKTAAKLLQAYGNLEGIYQHVDELKGKQKENIVNNKEMAFLSRTVATIVRDLDFDLDLQTCHFPSFDPERVTEAFTKVKLNAHLSRVLKLAGKKVEKNVAELVWQPLVKNNFAKRMIDAAIKRAEVVGVEFVDTSDPSLFNPEVYGLFNTSEGTAFFEGEEALDVFADLVCHGRFASLDVKRDIHRIYPCDSGRLSRLKEADVAHLQAFDLGLAGYVLNSSVAEYSFDTLLDAYKGVSLSEGADEVEQAALRACAARLLVDPLSEAVKKDGSEQAYFHIDLPLLSVLARMERTGTALDEEFLEKLGADLQPKINSLKDKIISISGEEFNIDSPLQLSHILFEVLGLTPLKKTQRGYSTDAQVLKELSKVHELPKLVLQYREFAKIKSTYIDALPRMSKKSADGRLHTSFNETVTTTGRLSSSDPNLQNISVRSELGRKVRESFIPLYPSHCFLSADYSQIELRVLAHLSQDKHLIEAFCSGADFHASTASRVFEVPLDQVTSTMRSRAKAVNFGIVYGQQAFGLAQSLDISFGEAKEMIERYFEVYAGVRTYLDNAIQSAKEKGYAETMFGRKRHIHELHSRNAGQRGFGERTAMNHPVQGSAADIIKLAMVEVQKRLTSEHFEANLLLQVHDELDFSVDRDEVLQLASMVKEVMEGIVLLRVPLVVDVSWGNNWAQAH